MLSPERSTRCLHPTTACTVRWSFCDSGFAIMVLKAPFKPSGSQELQARRAAPVPNSTHPPSHFACGCQPSVRFSAAGLVHPARSESRSHVLAHARFDDALQFLRSHAPQPCTAIGMRARAPPPQCSSCARILLSPPMARSPWLFYFGPKTDLACTHARSADAMQFLLSHAPQPYYRIQ